MSQQDTRNIPSWAHGHEALYLKLVDLAARNERSAAAELRIAVRAHLKRSHLGQTA